MPEPVQLITRQLIDETLERARASARKRVNHNFHASLDENLHRFLNVMVEGTYVQPHRHIAPPKAESFLVLEGSAVVFIFDERGTVEKAHLLGPGHDVIGVDIAPGVWHAPAVLHGHAVFFEVKPGPYSPANDKDFSVWSPREGTPESAIYLTDLLAPYRL